MALKLNGDVNLYELLGIDIEADPATIRKAYRKKALDCHPDKNPDNPKAAELFHQLSSVLEILSDPTARAAFDKVLKAKREAELRNKRLDSKRQKLKADLEDREREALRKQTHATHAYNTAPKTDEEILQEQIDRLRREGSKLLEEEQRLMREQLHRTINDNRISRNRNVNINDSTQNRIKIKWKSDKKDASNGGYTQDKLNTYLKKYGDINAIVMSKKNGSAIVEFKIREAAEMALAYERGCLDNPLQISWLATETKSEQKTTETARDFEDMVMRKLRQAEERRKLIEQMQKEDEEDV